MEEVGMWGVLWVEIMIRMMMMMIAFTIRHIDSSRELCPEI
jgi:hypothetical protein